MNSQITVAIARQILSGIVDPYNSSNPKFLVALNQIGERFCNSASWKGNVVDLEYRTDQNRFLTLPYYVDSLMAATVRTCPVPIFSEFNRFTEVGPGLVQEENLAGWPFFDLGDGFVTVEDIPQDSSGLLRTTISSSADVGKVVRYFGRDEDDEEIYDSEGNLGEQVVLANPFVLTTNQFSKVTGVQKEMTNGRLTLFWMDGVTPTELAKYAPGETIVSYHRYMIGEVEEDTTLGPRTISLKCRRRFVPLYAETDYVIPSSLGALKLALLAINAENAPNDALRQTALNYWADSYALLDQQHKTTRGAAIQTINFQPFASGVNRVWNST